MAADTIHAPWTAEQVAALNAWQTAGYTHPYTCGRRDQPGHIQRPDADLGQLIATPDGWVCLDCDYQQTWALQLMLTLPPDPLAL